MKGGKWIELIDDENEKWRENGNNIYYNNGNVGIGTSSPDRLLHSYFNNSNTNTSGFLVEQDGTGDAFMNFGLTGNHHYALGIDQSDGGKFKIGYSPTSPLGVHQNSLFSMRTNGQVGIGTASPTDRLQVDADSAEAALRVRINGATKLRVRNNGGVVIGENQAAPVDGLRVRGELQPNGNIVTANDLRIETTGATTSLEMKRGSEQVLMQDNRISATADEELALQTVMQNNTIDLGNTGISISTEENLTFESVGNNTIITINAGNTSITINESGGITIDSDGEPLTVNSQGGAMTFNSDGGDISFLAGNGNIALTGGDIDITAGRTLDMISDDEMYLESKFNRLDLKSGLEMKFNAGGRLFGMAGNDIKLDAGLNLDFDGNTFDFDGSSFDMDATGQASLNGSLILLNGPGLPAARQTDLCTGGLGPNPILQGSNTVLIGG